LPREDSIGTVEEIEEGICLIENVLVLQEPYNATHICFVQFHRNHIHNGINVKEGIEECHVHKAIDCLVESDEGIQISLISSIQNDISIVQNNLCTLCRLVLYLSSL